MSGTRERILAIAGQLFARQGYTGTTIADIAGELGTTTAALYYHFPSKAEILSALLTEPLAHYRRILDDLDAAKLAPGTTTPEHLLGAFVDLTVASRELTAVIDRDPTVVAMIDEHLPRNSLTLMTDAIAVLAGPDPSRAAVIRAHGAFALIKGSTQAALAAATDQAGHEILPPADRAEIIAAALRALAPS